MKKIILSLFFSVLFSVDYAQDRTIIITESALPYKNQTWFYSGYGNGLQEADIKSWWNEGKRITSAAYTNKGWFVTMSKESGIGMQTYKLSNDWPNEWIKKNWDENYRITSMSKSNTQWLVVMSQGTEITKQTWNRNDWNTLSSWIKENWDNGYYITNACYNGYNWTIVMSKDPKYSSQGYAWANNNNELNTKIKTKVWDRGYNLHLIEYGGDKYFIVYGNYKENNGRSQNWNVNPQDVGSYIKNRWDDSQNIAYIGGGNPSVNSSTTNYSNKNYNANIPTYPTPCELYIANEKGVVSSTSIREFEDTWHHTVKHQIQFWCADGRNHYLLYDRVSNGWYIYRGYDVAASVMSDTKYTDEWLYVKGDLSCVELVYSNGTKKRFDKVTTKEKYLEFDRNYQASKGGVIFNGGYGGNFNSGSVNNSNSRSSSSSSYTRCKYCGGGGGCNSCNGTGHKFNGYSGHEDSCPSCRGTGRCQICRGTGRL